MNKGTDTRRVPNNLQPIAGNSGQRWGTWLRLQRDNLAVTQDAFARHIASTCTYRNEDFVHFAQGLGLQREVAIAAFEISRFEKGVRVPAHRSTHLTLIWVLLRLGSQLNPDDVNDWLEMGGQGWLTDRERTYLFCGSGGDQSSPSDTAAVDEPAVEHSKSVFDDVAE